jgi:hypothetical protein
MPSYELGGVNMNIHCWEEAPFRKLVGWVIWMKIAQWLYYEANGDGPRVDIHIKKALVNIAIS